MASASARRPRPAKGRRQIMLSGQGIPVIGSQDPLPPSEDVAELGFRRRQVSQVPGRVCALEPECQDAATIVI